uniref:Uncharacterized protein n=1 Tax=Rhizophora mucronata TaxID=61149 RepID=A0A2P2PVX2_RHIMU
MDRGSRSNRYLGFWVNENLSFLYVGFLLLFEDV